MLIPGRRFLTRPALGELAALQRLVRELGTRRSAALRRLLTSRHAATLPAQREFWLEFSWLDAEYRCAVRRLAQFCLNRERTHGRCGPALPVQP